MELIKSIQNSSRSMLLYAIASTICFLLAYGYDIYALAILPFILPGILLIAEFPKLVFMGLFLTIPFSQHVPMFMGLSTELFSEQLMWLLCILAVIAFLIRGTQWNYKYLVHPISLLLILHIGWTVFTTVLSDEPIMSIKFLMAKTWFIVALFGAGLYFFRDKNLWKVFFWCTYISLLFIISVVMYRHMQEGFTFQSINSVISPFFSNHVYYAVVLVLFLPFFFIAIQWYRRFSLAWWLILLGIASFPIAIFLSYTRAAMIVMIGLPFIYLAFRLKLMKWGILVGLIAAGIIVTGLIKDNKYLDYAPEYSKTISHEDFGNLLEATYSGQDISTMERIYRWVAAYQMVKEKPLYGYGPSTFPALYKEHRLNMFMTYVSDNEEGSGIHNYYLMILVEQGIPGLLIFIALIFFVIAYGERVYHRVRDKFSRQILVTFLVTFVALVILNIINDLIEVDKMACYFFWTMVVIILVDFKTYESRSLSDNQ